MGTHRAPWLSALALLLVGLTAVPASAQQRNAPSSSQSQLPAPLADWMHSEQRLLSRAVDESRIRRLDNGQDRAYTPEEGRTFTVESYWVDADDTHTFTGPQLEQGLRTQFIRQVNGRTQVRLIVHPESRAFYRDVIARATPAGSFSATATASSRTLLVWQPGREDQAFFAKVSLDAEIGGVRRTIPASEVARSIGTARVLASEPDLPDNFRVLPEVIGVIPRGMPRGGMIIRQIPRAVLTGQVRYVPLFSLYARGANGRGTPLLAQMIQRSGMSPQDFVRARIVEPFVRQWTDLAVRHGITSEPHAQNVLLELDRDGQPTGNFVQRDFGGFDIDFPFREQLGLERPADLPHIGTFEHDYHLDENVDRFTKLETFFVGGFLHNLDQEMPGWQREGLISGAPMQRGEVARMLADAVESHLGRMVPGATSARLNGSVRAMARAMRATRQAFYTAQQRSGAIAQRVAARQPAASARATASTSAHPAAGAVDHRDAPAPAQGAVAATTPAANASPDAVDTRASGTRASTQQGPRAGGGVLGRLRAGNPATRSPAMRQAQAGRLPRLGAQIRSLFSTGRTTRR